MALPMLAMLMLSGDALVFLMSRLRCRLWERLLGRTLFLRSGIPGAWLRCSADRLCDRDSEGSGELRLDTSLRVGEEEVEVACRSMLISGSGGGGAAGAAAGAGISAFLAMGQVKAHASEIVAGLDLEAEAAKSRRCCLLRTLTARLLRWEMVWTRLVYGAERHCHCMRSALLLVARVNTALRHHLPDFARGSCARSRRK